MALAIPCAFALVWRPGRRSQDVLFFFLSQRSSTPAVGVIIPIFVIARNLGLIDSLLALVIVYTAIDLPITPIWLAVVLRRDPNGRDTSSPALMARASAADFKDIAIPMTLPGIVATVFICLIFGWNEFFLAVNLMATRGATVPMFMISFVTSEGLFWAKLAAAGTMAMLPVVILGFACAKTACPGSPRRGQIAEVEAESRCARSRSPPPEWVKSATCRGPDPGPGGGDRQGGIREVCGTDCRIYHGEFNSRGFRSSNGHEFSGVVSDVGADVVDWHPGDRVTVDPTYCGHCYHCLRRQSNHCDHWGAISDTRDGALAEFVRVPARNLYRVDDSVRLDGSPHRAARVRGLGVERLQLMPASHALIFGAGPIGFPPHGPAECKRHGRRHRRRRRGLQAGDRAPRFAHSATFTTGPDLDAILRERRQGRGYDAVIDCTGVPSVIELFRHAGECPDHVLRGRPPAAKGRSVRSMSTTRTGRSWDRWRSTTPSSRRTTLSSRRIDVQSLIRDVVDLDEVGDILRRPKEAGELKTLVAPNRV